METMRGQAVTWKNGKVILSWYTMGYDCTGKSAPHIQGAITKRIKQEVKELNADYAEVHIHYSVLPNGPFCTRSIGRVQP